MAGLRSPFDIRQYFEKDRVSTEGEKPKPLALPEGMIWTCNICPIYIEEYEFNFDRGLKDIMRSCDYWDQLNGRQKMNKFRTHIENNLRVLYHELNEKC